MTLWKSVRWLPILFFISLTKNYICHLIKVYSIKAKYKETPRFVQRRAQESEFLVGNGCGYKGSLWFSPWHGPPRALFCSNQTYFVLFLKQHLKLWVSEWWNQFKRALLPRKVKGMFSPFKLVTHFTLACSQFYCNKEWIPYCSFITPKEGFIKDFLKLCPLEYVQIIKTTTIKTKVCNTWIKEVGGSMTNSSLSQNISFF